MKGYRLTRKGWIALFSLALIVVIALAMAVSAIIGNINNIVKRVEVSEKKTEQSKPTPKIVVPELTKENTEVVIYFTEGSSLIQKENLPVLDMIVKASKGIKTYKYAIVAYTYSNSDKVTEQKMDRQEKITVEREKEIRDYLVKKGIPDEKIGIRETLKNSSDISTGQLDRDKNIRKIQILLLVENK